MKKYLHNRDGQMFLLAGLIALLLLSTIPILIFLTNNASLHQAAQIKRSQALSIAETGIAYATHQLNSAGVWTGALGNVFLAASGCNTGNVTIPGGGTFRLACTNLASAVPELEPAYQVAITATAYMPVGRDSNTLLPTRSMQALVSRRTLGVTLPDGTQAAVAVQLARVPTSNQTTQAVLASGALTVHWGPIACYQLAPTAPPGTLGPTVDPAAWTLPDPLDRVNCGGVANCEGYPRVFSNGGLGGATYPRLTLQAASAQSTDNYQWWAFSSLQVPPQIDTATYVTNAIGQLGGAITGVTTLPLACATVNGNLYTGGAPGCVVNLTAAITWPAGAVMVVDGNADVIITNTNVTGTLIVVRNLTISAPTAGAAKALNVPTSAYKEYAAIAAQNAGYAWPCGTGARPSAPGFTCTSTTALGGAGRVNFTGFLYVQNTMTVTAPWVLNGALAVGDMSQTAPTGTGQLVIPAAGALTVLYDATIGHAIRVGATELEVDSIRTVSNP
jgi:hypothetical protein